jgi:hypothetical protein
MTHTVPPNKRHQVKFYKFKLISKLTSFMSLCKSATGPSTKNNEMQARFQGCDFYNLKVIDP